MEKKTDIERLLKSISKRCFRNCYDTAVRLGESFDVDALLECDPTLKRTGKGKDARRTRVSNIKKLIKEGLGEEALARCNKRSSR